MKKKTAAAIALVVTAGCYSLPNGTITKKKDQGNNGYTICVEDIDGKTKCDLVNRKDSTGCDVGDSWPGCSNNP
jgi:hypothetical protein